MIYRGKIERICPTCHGHFHVFPSQTQKYCSKKCWGVELSRLRTGEGHPLFGHCRETNPNWRGGRKKDRGYIMVLNSDHPRAFKIGKHSKYVYEHVLAAERKLGRSIKPEERIHHVDGNRANNSQENLLILPNHTEHSKLHSGERKRNGLGQFI